MLSYALVFQFLELSDLSQCAQVSKLYNDATKHKLVFANRQPFPTLKTRAEFQDWFTSGISGAMVELSTNEVINDAMLATQPFSYTLHRHWTAAPIYRLVNRTPGTYIELSFTGGPPGKLTKKKLKKCFEGFEIMGDTMTSPNELVLFKSASDHKSPIVDTLHCVTGDTYEGSRRKAFATGFTNAWNKLEHQPRHNYQNQTRVTLSLPNPTNPRKSRHVCVLGYFMQKSMWHYERPQPMADKNINVKSLTLLARNNFIKLEFDIPLAYGEYMAALLL
jgi:hypothetical protein